MNIYKLATAGVNISEGLKRFGGSNALYEKYLGRFATDTNYVDMCRFIGEGKVKEAFAAAHALKGLTGNLSFSKLYGDLQPLVEELRAGSLVNAADLLAPVQADYDAVIEALKNAE